MRLFHFRQICPLEGLEYMYTGRMDGCRRDATRSISFPSLVVLQTRNSQILGARGWGDPKGVNPGGCDGAEGWELLGSMVYAYVLCTAHAKAG